MAHRTLKPEYSAELRRRKVLRYVFVFGLILFCLSIALDHVGCFGYRGDDWALFDGKRAIVRSVGPHGTILVSGGGDAELNLLGILPPDDPDFARVLSDRLSGKSIIVRLEPLQTRDAPGHLLGYVYLAEDDCLNIDLVREGLARADRLRKHSMRAAMEGAEADARKHARGIWRDTAGRLSH